MIDESRVNFIQDRPEPKKEITTKYIPRYDERKCEKCQKPTRSHKFRDKTVLCHGCYNAMSDEELDRWREVHAFNRYNTGQKGQ